ncbi:hypothetical protein Scep_009576 [Stephania cephalantha]|uniref:Uncharacterized protein n=1 Tax=Stephania cephalantha TaxID=152367 RepID=A0AAP0JUG5_9MAGN
MMPPTHYIDVPQRIHIFFDVNKERAPKFLRTSLSPCIFLLLFDSWFQSKFCSFGFP